ncbi:hypothetical protein, partial [Streptomyces sp. NPDC048643]|uniref:hypothetical protein n=1 Tax=Streptomyces sp. NPDC048643 TaxID=3155637 RepID=UPI00343EF64B
VRGGGRDGERQGEEGGSQGRDLREHDLLLADGDPDPPGPQSSLTRARALVVPSQDPRGAFWGLESSVPEG